MNRSTLLCALLCLYAAAATGQEAANDPGFGANGWAFTGWDPDIGVATDTMRAMAMQPDGRLILAGSSSIHYPNGSGTSGCAITRLHPAGHVDTSFGVDGRVLFTFPAPVPPGTGNTVNSCTIESVAIDANGRIIAAARQQISYFDSSNQHQRLPDHAALMRLMPDGSPDTSFSFDGRMHFHFGQDLPGIDFESLTVLALPDGKLFLTMTLAADQDFLGFDSDERVGTARITTTGELDSSYFSNGKRVLRYPIIPPNQRPWGARHAQLDGQGRVLITGHVYNSSGTSVSMWVGRLLADGSTDTSFGSGSGSSWFQLVAGPGSPGLAEARSLTLDDQYRVLLVGTSLEGSGDLHVMVARLSPDGLPDTGFGTAGRVVLPFQYLSQTTPSSGRSIRVDAEGRIVVAGQLHRILGGGAWETLIATARLNGNGALDGTYWTGGGRVIDSDFQPVGSRRDTVVQNGLSITPSGRILIGATVLRGHVPPQPDTDFAVLALRGGEPPDPIFADGFEGSP